MQQRSRMVHRNFRRESLVAAVAPLTAICLASSIRTPSVFHPQRRRQSATRGCVDGKRKDALARYGTEACGRIQSGNTRVPPVTKASNDRPASVSPTAAPTRPFMLPQTLKPVEGEDSAQHTSS